MNSHSPIALIPQHFGSLVFDRRTSRYMPFDHESTAVLKGLHHQSIAEYLTNVGDSHRREQILSFYHYFYDKGFFTVNGHLAAEILTRKPPSSHLAGPLAVHLEIIGACNLACSHCFAGELPRNHQALTLDEIDTLFEELASMGSFRLGLTGGEPLMRRDLLEIIDAATLRGLHPCLTTNGLLITEEIAKALGQRDLTWVNVSLDGASARTNDAVRGKGVFDSVIKNLKILRKHARFTLAFTITSQNVDEVESCVALARETGALTAVFRPLYPVGTALNHLELMPQFEDYTRALERISTAVGLNGDIRGIDPFSPQSRKDAQAKVYANRGCGAGNLIASISVQGQVNPCSFLGSDFDAGNLRHHSFSDIWNQSQGFQEMRSLSQAEDSCEGCFKGGCRARAKAYHGDIDRADPWQEAYDRTTTGLPPLSNLHWGEMRP